MNKRKKQQVHECGQPLCHSIVPVGERFCAKHKAMHEVEWQAKKASYRRSKLAMAIKANKSKEYDKLQRDPEAVSFYHSKQWQKVRDYVYARDGATCQVCGNIVQNRKIVDHVTPRRLCSSNKQALDSSNLWTLCYRCHFRKTKLEESLAKKPGGDNILRHLDRRWWTKVLKENDRRKK